MENENIIQKTAENYQFTANVEAGIQTSAVPLRDAAVIIPNRRRRNAFFYFSFFCLALLSSFSGSRMGSIVSLSFLARNVSTGTSTFEIT